MLEGRNEVLDVLSFPAAVKISWLHKINCPDTSLCNFVMNSNEYVPSVCKLLRKSGGEYTHILMHRMQNPFGKDV